MHPDYGYFEESQLGKAYDFRLMRRLLPFARPYRRLLIWSVGLVVLITMLELSLPYVTKMAIDRFIVPSIDMSQTRAESADAIKKRWLRVPISNQAIKDVADRYPELITIVSGTAEVAYTDLEKIERSDLAVLRHRDVIGLAILTGIFLLLVFVDLICNFFQKLIMETTGHRIMHDLRMRLYEHTDD